MTQHPTDPQGAGDAPSWNVGKPDGPCTVIGYACHSERPDEKPSLYAFDGRVFQHWTGFYDHAVTHWMPSDLPAPDPNGSAPNTPSPDLGGGL